MSHHEPTIVIGKGRGGGGGGPRPVALKTNSQINAAARAGNLTSTKRVYGTANGSIGSLMQGQRLARVDRADGPMPTPKNDKDEQIQWNLHILTTHLGITHDQLAKAASKSKNELFKPNNAAPSWKPTQDALTAVENKFAWCVRGKYGPKGACKSYAQGLEYQTKIKEKWDGKQPVPPSKRVLKA